MNGLVSTFDQAECKRAINKLIAAKKKKRALTNKEHECHVQHCNPENEVALFEQGLLDGQPETSNVFLCNYGKVHVCSDMECKHSAYAPGTACPISGIIHQDRAMSDYSRADFRTWNSTLHTADKNVLTEKRVGEKAKFLNRKKLFSSGMGFMEFKKQSKKEEPQAPQQAPKKKRRIGEKKQADRNKIARNVIERLLYDPARTQVNNTSLERARKYAEKAQQTYVQDMLAQKAIPFWTDMYRIVATAGERAQLLQILPYSETTVSLYINIINQIWTRVVLKWYKPDGPLDFEAFCIHLLYTLTRGYILQQESVLPMDRFLLRNLPKINDFKFFRFDRKKHTTGEIILTEAYESALEQGCTPRQLALDMSLLPEQEVIQNYKRVAKGLPMFMINGKKVLKDPD